jgi:ADP-ribosylglycohydrolase
VSSVVESAVVAAERFPGVVLGSAIGDALGYPVEFSSMGAIRARFGAAGVTGYVDYRSSAGRRFAPYSDDTQMAQVVLESLLESRAEQADLDGTMRRLANGFVDWARHPRGGHRNPGAACLAGCEALAAGSPWSEAGEESAGGCGSVMRVYPFALVFCDEAERAEEWAVEHSKLTHRSPIAFAACAAFVCGLLALLRDASSAELCSVMSSAAERHDRETASRLRGAERAALTGEPPESVLRRYPGWAAHDAIAAAYYVFARHADDPRAALLEAVNSPGDSDSIGALVGALLGARHGLERLPTEWVDELERSDELMALAASATTAARGRLGRSSLSAKAFGQSGRAKVSRKADSMK